MVYAGISHLTFNRQEFVAQVPTWLQFSPAFTDFVVLASGVVEIAFGLGIIFLALWTTGGWKYWKLWAKGKFFAETSAKRLSTYGAQESGRAERSRYGVEGLLAGYKIEIV